MNVWFVASEAAPLVKTGGLADVAGALPKALGSLGIDVTVVLPKYGAIPASYKASSVPHGHFRVSLGWRSVYCGLEELTVDGVRFLLIDNETYFKRDQLYGYGDEAERFVFFSMAVLEAMARCDRLPDVLHCHDWQTGLVPFLLRTRYSYLPQFRSIRTVFTIHNLHYQGVFGRELLQDLLGAGDDMFGQDGLEFYGAGSCMKAGIRYADKLTTVSPSYAAEIQSSEYGERLDGLLRQRAGDLTGIVNGIDTSSYDPAGDPHLAAPYSRSSGGKRLNKRPLQQELGLEPDEEVPVIGIVSRLVAQKGLELIGEALPALMAEDVQLAVLGSGDARYERMLLDGAAAYPGRLAVRLRFDEGLARRIYAGSDLFLMPSLFEPCGLSQLISLRYGTVPIVRETGGLRDTVQSFNEYTGEGNGFSFGPAAAHDLAYTVRRALSFYRDREAWERIVRNGELSDIGWETSAGRYAELYRELLKG
ncbi:glycogen synthase GlgA [Paenibacillus sp. GYB004]|uniref:glycogen synthase GlgA n=1 Tax=Paenibacillus sp. GYB004 TaxID=2994393 RepID=UPI002F961CC2